MFEEALKRLAIQPNECLHIGDDIEHDVMGASRLGIRTVWFNTYGQFPGHDVPADYTITNLRQLLNMLK